MWSNIISAGANIVGKLFGGNKAIADASSTVGSIADTIGKIPGVPTPVSAMSGAEAGGFQKDFMDNAYPGTTPWERLGAPGAAGSAITADASAKTEQTMQKRELETRERIANKSNLASIIASSSPNGAIAMDEAVKKYASSGLTDAAEYDTSVKQKRDLLPSERSRNVAAARHSIVSARKEKLGFPKERAIADVGNVISGGIHAARRIGDFTPIALAANAAGEYSERMYTAAHRIRRMLSNNDKHPARFD